MLQFYKKVKRYNIITIKINRFYVEINPSINVNESNINIKRLSLKNKFDGKEFNYNTPTIKTNSSKQIIQEEEKYNNYKTNNNFKKINTAEFKEKLCLYSDKEEEKSSQKKYPNSFPLLKASRRKTILNKIFEIPMEVSPFNMTEKNIKDENKINNTTKIVNASENINQNIIKTKVNTTSEHNIDTNFTTLGITSPVLSDRKNSFLNFKKISIFNKKNSVQNQEKWRINRTYLKKDNKLIEPIGPTHSLLNTTSRRSILNYNSFNSDNNNKKSKIKEVELGDYTKFSSIFFPPCIIKTKEKSTNKSFFYTKDGFMKKTKRIRKKKFKGIDFSKTLLKTYDEIKDEVYDELEQQRNSDINGISAILKLKKDIKEKMDKFHFVDFNRNRVTFKNFFIVHPEKMKKYN